jgi:transcriptional pleiotropic regulator of transition state genes
MRPIGVVRKIDPLGRIVLPAGLRKEFDINVGDPLELFVDGAGVLLKKYVAPCVFCNGREDVKEYKGKPVCDKCMEELINK